MSTSLTDTAVVETATDLDLDRIKSEILDKYPTKVARKRAKQIVINRPGENNEIPEIGANIRTVPGILTQRGCCYAGCKGVILGPTRDVVNIVHGPVGCSFYAWLTRRNQTRPPADDAPNYMPYAFTTDMQDENIVFGGEKKLKQAIQEAYDIFHPHTISVFSTCPVGLIGDDIHAVCREMKEELGINIFGFSCEGYKGVSQSAGHHIANNGIFKNVVGRDDTIKGGKFRINLLGEYNIGGDAFEIERILEACGISLISTFSGNSTIEQFANAHTADLNAVMCHRSITYMAEMMETKYGMPWLKINFIGAEATAKSLRKIAQYFEDEELIAKVEEVIKRELVPVKEEMEKARALCEGKLAMLFVGGSRAHHYQELFSELGMKTVSAGYEFGHRDDYEGRRVLPSIKVDADSRNIEELAVMKDPEKYRLRKTEEELSAIEDKGVEFREYGGLIEDMKNNTFVIDDISQYETEKIIEAIKPDIFCAGIKEKYVIQKSGVPMKQLHSYDYGGPYAGFKGAVNFYQEIARMTNSKVWSYVKAPWEREPELAATYAHA
jgi:nitrogenase molybdenum-iron protein alpha chain